MSAALTAPLPATLASRVYEDLRRDVIQAVFPAGHKLLLKDLCARYCAGLSPVREALNRLAGDGLVEQSDQRGFSVAQLDLERLDELTRTRSWLYALALRESVAHGDAAWEEALVLAFHRLSRAPRYLDDTGEGEPVPNPQWEAAHRAFHLQMIAACRSQLLVGYCAQLFDAADRYRHLSRVSKLRRRQRGDEHREVLDLVIARDADGACALLEKHFSRTAALVRERLAPAR
ncbi:MAG: GntR family transcriptional regulator [Burkholderiales bacterium]|nr:GntR family transcriptional regulator [Burkholderiales bacterium]